ncbi:tail completion protein gp17 [Roseateles cavernae]|uniref:tail completion protein gp17 n=1 Tax=Roseateles cavernae TaxID=3153578 RepID=UPI0032E4D2A8
MSTSHQDLRAALLAFPGLTALVGQSVHIDFAPAEAPQPFVVVKGDGIEYIRGLDGSRHGQIERFDVEAWADRRSVAVAVSEQCLLALEAASYWPESKQPDGIDPELLERVCVLTLEI